MKYMDCCCPEKDDRKTDGSKIETATQGYNQKSGNSHGGCCGCNPWIMLAMIILFILIWYFVWG
jgi:hypothetical protein